MNFLTLNASPSSDLDWEDVSHQGAFFLDFGPIDPNDEAKQNANLLAVQEFARAFPDAKEVILAKTDGKIKDPDAFSRYLHLLAAQLPDEATAILLCEIEEDALLEDLVLIFCRRRFEHFTLQFSKKIIPIEGDEAIAVVLPQDEKYDPQVFKEIFASIEGDFKCIPEELLNEHWDGVDHLIVEPKSLGEMGKRMLLGFEAAGGEVISLEKKSE
ncbi:MAG: hypothetical protein P0S96_04085 [Simkaniaceae bacterium]|nr:hypothetical protein [Candidatus Sacchlamyda saccharinae]